MDFLAPTLPLNCRQLITFLFVTTHTRSHCGVCKMALSMFWSVCEKYFFVDFGGRAEGISVDRLKPAQHLDMPVELALPPRLGCPPAWPDAPGKPPVITPHRHRKLQTHRGRVHHSLCVWREERRRAARSFCSAGAFPKWMAMQSPPLGLAIGLGGDNQKTGLLMRRGPAECPPHSGRELRASVRDDVPR